MNYYNSIHTCPVRIFSEVMKTGDYDLLAKGRTYKHEGKKAFVRLYDEYLKEFGFPADYKAYMKLRIEASVLYAKSLEQKHYITLAKVKEQQAFAVMNVSKSEGGSLLDTAAMLSKEIGFAIDINTCTVAQFYSYLRVMGKK